MTCERSKRLNAVSMLTGSFGVETDVPSVRRTFAGAAAARCWSERDLWRISERC
jgi:hypothetical protein